MTIPDVAIVVPTYKEAENIPVLSEKIHNAMTDAKLTYEIVVVDDDSKDGIEEAVEKLKTRFNIKIKVRINEKGLSSAVIEGFKISESENIVVMDADLSHPAEKIPELIDQIKREGAEFVIGSRFVKGGGAAHFGLFRNLNAWISKTMARPFTKTSDPMAGFFAFPRRIMPDYDTLNPLGFKIGLEMIVKAEPKKITEIPIVFKERLHGESKLSLKEQIFYILHLKRLFEYKYKTLAEFIKFSLIGGSGVFVDLFFVFITKEYLSLEFRIARIVGFVFALTSNFILNRKFTFDNGKNGNIVKQYLSFLAVCLMGFGLNWVISVYLHENISFFHVHYLIASGIGIIGGTLINFIGSKFIVFK